MDHLPTTGSIPENVPMNLQESPKPTYPLIDVIFPPLENANALQSHLGQERTTQQDSIPSAAADLEPVPSTPSSPNSPPTSDPDSFQTAVESFAPQAPKVPFPPPLPANGCGFPYPPYGAFPMMNAPFGMFPFVPQGPTVPFSQSPPFGYGFPYPPYGSFPMMHVPLGMFPMVYPPMMTTTHPPYQFPVPPVPFPAPQIQTAAQPAQNLTAPRRTEAESPTQAPPNQEISRKRKQAPTT